MTTVISSVAGGSAMQVGAVATTKLLNWASNRKKKGRKKNPDREDNPLGNLPEKASRQWEHVYESALDRGLDQGAAAAQAWCAVKRGYYQKGNRWLKRKKPLGRDEQPPGCTPYTANPADVRKLKAKLLR